MAPLHSSLLATVLGAIAAVDLEAQSLVRRGIEFQVNGYTIDNQSGPSVGMDDDGDFVVAWRSKEQDGDAYGVFARRFDATGVALAAEFQINTFTSHNQGYPRVGTAANGNFVVVWQSDGQDAFGEGVFARRFDAGGTPLATEFQVGLRTLTDQYHPTIAMRGNGDFVIAWASEHDGYFSGVLARRFGSDGGPLATEFQVNTYTPGSQYDPAIAIEDDGDFVVAWVSWAPEADSPEIIARRFDGEGPAGAELAVNAFATGRQMTPAVGMGADGDFVVAWRSFQTGGFDGIFARGFGAAGAPLGPEHQMNATFIGEEISPAVVARPGGDFVVAWDQRFLDGDSYGAFARKFAAGTPAGADFQLNTYTTGAQLAVAVSARGGDLVTAWDSSAQDDSGSGIFAQRFSAPAVLDVDADGNVGALTDGLLVLRFMFGFTGAPLTAGALGPDCQRCDAGAIESYLGGLT